MAPGRRRIGFAANATSLPLRMWRWRARPPSGNRSRPDSQLVGSPSQVHPRRSRRQGGRPTAGQSPIELELAAEAHDIEISADRYKTWRGRAEVGAGQPVALPEVRLEPATADWRFGRSRQGRAFSSMAAMSADTRSRPTSARARNMSRSCPKRDNSNARAGR